MKTAVELIESKRDGYAHVSGEIASLVEGFVRGEVPDYQMSAWLMAVCIRGLDGRETAELTETMAHSGRMLDLSEIPGVVLDKHSTGGVGDTTTLVVAPLVASCGVPVAKMSGRGLGFTGGTLDKLESIPGFRVDLSPEAFQAQVARVGVAVIAQTADVAPADKMMYALRDVTGTVSSVPLIVASIMSKKIAGGAGAIVLDVKTGSGAFMKSEEDSRTLAAELTRVGALLGRRVSAVMTDMDQPLGPAVGNALEVRAAIDVLRGGTGAADLREVSLALAARMLVLGGAASGEGEARRLLGAHLADGSALEVFRRWVAAQGGDPRVADDVSLLPVGAEWRTLVAPRTGYVRVLDAERIGRAAMALGAGRERAGASIDHAAGIELHVRVGTFVETGTPVATLYASDAALLAGAAERFAPALVIGDGPPVVRPLVREV